MNQTSLIQKYNVSGPRYTSFPPVPFWRQTPSESLWIDHLRTSYDRESGLDLYVHVPFCESLCYYCGCNRTITKDRTVEHEFVETLLREWRLYQEKFGFLPKVSSLHLGGGTPTFLSPNVLRNLLRTLTESRTESFIGSIEVDPRTCTFSHIQVLQELGIRRVSLGIQDFDLRVQQAIHRTQSTLMVSQLVKKLRASGVTSVNFDLIYGLPAQTTESIRETIEIVRELNPDLIAFYSYAHLPDRIKNQKLIDSTLLPQGEEKRALYEIGKELLRVAGFEDIGMDHFALPGSFLSTAYRQGRLHRNFMGYVDKKSSVLLGLGPSSISDSGVSFIQNEKDLNVYKKKISQGRLAIEKGHSQSARDLMVQGLIQSLMCRNEVDLRYAPMLPFWKEIRQELAGFETDGLVELRNDLLRLTETGKGFMRNVAMSFDFYLREQQHVRFSQTV